MTNTIQNLSASYKILSVFEEANSINERILDRLPGVFCIINENAEIIRSNAEAGRLLGISQEQLLRMHMSLFFNDESWEIFKFKLAHLIQSQENSMQFELSINHEGQQNTEKSFFWLITDLNIRNHAEGKLFSVIGEDLSGLREAEKKLREIFTSIPLGIFTIDEYGCIENFYSNYLESLIEETNIVGRPFQDVLFGSDPKQIDPEDQRAIESIQRCLGKDKIFFDTNSEHFPAKTRFLSKQQDSENKWFRISYQPIFYNAIVRRLLIMVEDRTKLVNAEKLKQKADLLQQQSRALYEAAIRDPLTGLYTRLYMQNTVNRLLNGFNRGTIDELCLIFFDIDHFKKVNDTHGHKEGDKVLAMVAKVILRQIRESDLPVRYGGEEFLIFVHSKESCLGSGPAVAERIRKEVAKSLCRVKKGSISVTISGGVSAYRKNEKLEKFIERADSCLYEAKKQGRNRIILDTTIMAKLVQEEVCD